MSALVWRRLPDKQKALVLREETWLRAVMFSQSSRSARKIGCNMLEAMWQLPGRRQHIIDMLTRYSACVTS